MKKSRKGFTLAELLIVVAIIAVLVAIAIPIFRKQIEKSKEAYDIATMRQAASAAVDLYYAGVTDEASALAAGLSWSPYSGGRSNAYGAYGSNGKIYKSKNDVPAAYEVYGKGTTVDGGTKFTLGNPNGAYVSNRDYTDAVVMVSIYPDATPARVDVYWKKKRNGNEYIGGEDGKNVPKYSIRITLD